MHTHLSITNHTTYKVQKLILQHVEGYQPPYLYLRGMLDALIIIISISRPPFHLMALRETKKFLLKTPSLEG